ncbi:MAG: hypothetical protein HYZ81_25050 [Nitrospinae bacterium]|nr:hypothetical protein [Nitrospinota bacterium]
MTRPEVTELRSIAKLLEGRGDIALARRLKRIASMVESLVQPRNKAEVHITGLLFPMLRHLIYLAEAQARGIERPERAHWEREVQAWLGQIQAINRAPKLRRRVYFSPKEIDALSEEIVDALKETAREQLAVEGFQPPELTSDLVKQARMLSDFAPLHPAVRTLLIQ